MLLKIHEKNPEKRLVSEVVKTLQQGGIIIYPTDTVYGLGCDIYNKKAVERIAQIKGKNAQQSHLSFICKNLSDLSTYAKSIDTPTYRMLKSYLPGPYTFILPASKEVPKILQSKKSTIGLRVPGNAICQAISDALEHPFLSTSLPLQTSTTYYYDPEEMYKKFGKQVDIVIDGGTGGSIPSTVVDCTSDDWTVIRQGSGAFPKE